MNNCGILLFLFCFVFVVQGYPNGAPTTQDSCLNLQPLHTDPVTGEQYPNQQNQAPLQDRDIYGGLSTMCYANRLSKSSNYRYPFINIQTVTSE